MKKHEKLGQIIQEGTGGSIGFHKEEPSMKTINPATLCCGLIRRRMSQVKEAWRTLVVASSISVSSLYKERLSMREVINEI